MPSHITLKDIAHDLKISYATVSLALNDAPGVNEETRQRVKEYARRVRYRPNASARAISTGRTYLVGVVLGRLTDSFFEELVQGMENVANRYGYDLIVNTVSDDPQPRMELIERLLGRHIDGLIGTAFSLAAPELRLLEEVKVPVLLLRQEAADTGPFVAVDHRLGGQIAGRHLRELGHWRILFVGDDSSYSQLRADGARQALSGQAGRVEFCPVERALDVEGARRAVRARLRRGRDFTAVFCADDMLGVGACKALSEARIAVPEEMSVVGYDDLKWTQLLTPPLTTIRQPQVSQGETAMQMLVDVIEGKEINNRILQPRLVVRGSTGPAPRRVDSLSS